ncbi:MAG TPA: sigma-70 family RNA polymerase sigma factor [Candidatus Limnocylindrales bacterium]|nr:sigma-70 family RNA polymerase sigma factor [Candidatus Limnocylindrales bacterium]
MSRVAPKHSDAELMARVVAGDEEALGALYDRHAPAIQRVAFRLLGDRGLAEDVVQETILALWNRAELFDARVASLPAWLLTIARNRALDRLRARARRPNAMALSAVVAGSTDEQGALERLLAGGDLLGSAVAADADPAAALDATWLRAVVRDALAGMPQAERQAIWLAYYEDLSQSEIAARLGWPLGTVKTRTRRALARLRGILATSLGPDLGAQVGVLAEEGSDGPP